jgi:hypothetical protein
MHILYLVFIYICFFLFLSSLRLFYKVTETEIINGLFNFDDKENKCVSFFRDIIDIDSLDKTSSGLERYIETNPEVVNLHLRLKQRIKEALINKNIVSIPVSIHVV